MLERQAGMQEVQSNAQQNPSQGGNGQGEADPLAKLYRMSTTAGVGTQEYVAINPTAVVALLLGFSSILIVLSNVLLVIPVVGFICAVIALVQIQRSFHTQTGRGLAIFGMILCVGVTAGRLVFQQIQRNQLAGEEKQIAVVVHEFGTDIGSSQYNKAYQLFDDRFRERVSQPAFEGTFKGFRTAGPLGGVQSIEWNQQPMTFEDSTDSNNAYASAMTFFQFEHDQPRRVVMGFEKSDGKRRIHEIEAIFPSKKSAGQQ